MGYFPVRYDSRAVIYERKMFIRLAIEVGMLSSLSYTEALVPCLGNISPSLPNLTITDYLATDSGT